MGKRPNASSMPRSPTWELLVAFLLTDPVGDAPALRAQFTRTGQLLGLSAERLEQVQQTVMAALSHLLTHTQGLSGALLVRICVYCNRSAPAPTPGAPPSAAVESNRPAPRDAGNWGFFLVEKSVGVGDTHHYLVEMYLYQESA